MARTLISPQSIPSGGLAPTYEPANAAGNSYRLVSGAVLHVKNAGASACNLTVETPLTVDGLAVADRTITIPAGTNMWVALGSDTSGVYRQSGGVVFIDYDQVTSVTVAVLTIP